MIIREEGLNKVVVQCGNSCHIFVVVEMVLESGIGFLKFNTKGVEQFSVWERSIDISDHHHVASSIEVRHYISGFDFAVDFYR